MSGAEGQLAVVIAPETAEEASRHFSALLAGGYHPVMDYGPADKPLGNFPVLVPVAELGEAKAFLRGLRANHASKPVSQLASMFDPSVSDRPTGPIPKWKFSETIGKALGVLFALVVLAGGIVALVLMLQFFSSLKGH